MDGAVLDFDNEVETILHQGFARTEEFKYTLAQITASLTDTGRRPASLIGMCSSTCQTKCCSMVG